VTRTPEFDELVDPIEPEEDERLRRVHELLIEAGPPPDLSPALASVAPPTDTPETDEDERDLSWMPPRRLGAGIVLAGAVLAATFGLGYLAGGSDSDGGQATESTRIVRTAPLTGSAGATGIVNVGPRDADGNWPMIVTVRGLAPLTQGDYYIVALSKKGKPIVTCGTFNVADRGQRTLRMSAAYDLKGFDGWVVTRWDAKTHDETPVLWSKRA
jgi:hypothetical protein